MKGLNLSSFKKIAEDKNSATLIHQDGHKIMIAKAPLPALQRKQLEKLPIHLEEGTGELWDPHGEDAPSSATTAETAADIGASAGAPQEISAGKGILSASAAKPPSEVQGTAVAPPAAEAPEPQKVAAVDTGYNEYLKGLQQQQDVERQLAEKQLVIDQDHQVALQKLMSDADTHNKAYEENQQKFMQDVQAGHIDPKHYQQGLDTTQRVGQAIGLFLSGWGSAYTGQNPALDYLNKQIANDIAAQKENNIIKPKTLLEANMQHYQNQVVAEKVTENQIRDITLQKAKVAADELGTPQAQAKYNLLAGMYKNQNAANQQQIIASQALRQQMQESSATGKPSSLDPAKLVPLTPATPEEKKEMYKEIGTVQAVKSNAASILANWDKMAEDLSHPLYAVGATPPSEHALGPLEDSIIHDNDGRINEIAKKDLTALHPSRLDFLHEGARETKRKALVDFLEKKGGPGSAPVSSAHGLDLGNFQSTSTPIQKSANQSHDFKVGQTIYVNSKPATITNKDGEFKYN